MNNSTQTSRKATFNQLQKMFEEAVIEGPEAIESHLRDVAFSLGAQAAIITEPNQIPDAINDLIAQFGHGIQTVIQEITGKESKFDVAVYAVQQK